MHKNIIILAILIISILIPLAAVDVSYNGLSHTSLAMSFDGGDITHYKQSINLSVDMYKDISHLFIQPYVTIAKDESVSFNIREAYAEFYLDNIDIKVGKQIIASGQADALFLTDIITPRNLQDFVLTETPDLKKGIPAIKGSYYIGDYTIEGIWVTQFSPTSLYDSSSIWSSLPLILPPSATVTMREPEMPEISLENSEVFAKLHYFGSLINYEIVGGYTYSDEPHISSLTVTYPSPLAVTLSQEYDHYSVIGGSLSTVVGPVVIRGESILSFDKAFSSVTTAPAPSTVAEGHNYLQALFGVDWKLLGFDISNQYMLSYITEHHDSLVYQGRYVDEFSHVATLRVQKKFFDDRFTFQLFTIAELEPFNALLRPSLTYEIEDAVSVKTEVLLFMGDEEGLYGKYKDNSLIALSLYWYF